MAWHESQLQKHLLPHSHQILLPYSDLQWLQVSQRFLPYQELLRQTFLPPNVGQCLQEDLEGPAYGSIKHLNLVCSTSCRYPSDFSRT